VAAVALCAEKATSPDKKSCLWRIKSKTNTVYVLGSIHLLKKENYPLNEAIEKAFDDSKKLTLEVNLASVNPEDAQKLVLTKGMLGDDKTLKESLGKETYELAKKKLAELGASIEQMSKFKPWLLGVMLGVTKMQKLGFDPQQGVDRYFFDKAKKANKEVVGLETMDYQINLFDKMAAGEQEQMLLHTLKELDMIEKELNKIVTSWASGDIKALETILLESFKEYPEFRTIFVTQRNKNWVPKIESFLKEDANYLVVVGAAHLIGKEGVIELLKDKGYSAEQL
jgi:uncharacterized protein YbaP (TraB family)